MQLNFMGIFDTVASVGVAASSRLWKGKMNWAEGEMMSIHPEVKKCVHFAALHEQRINFPSDLAIGNQVEEVFYPGMHSDVGGGYGPGSQGKDSVQGRVDGTAKLAQIPLVDMHHAALSSGVLLKTMEELRRTDLSDHFVCHPQLISDYNAWLAAHAVPAGTPEQKIRRHCEQYVQWKGTRLLGRRGESQLETPFFLRADDEDQFDLRKAHQNFGELVSVLAKGKADIAYARERSKVLQQEGRPNVLGQRPTYPVLPTVSSEPGRAATQYWRLSEGSKRLLDIVIADKPVAPAVSKLFDDYVHDSLAGFYMSTYTELNVPVLKSDGYLRYREVFSVVGSKAALVCVDPLTTPLPPANVPGIGQIFGDMGRAMGGF